MHHKQVRMKPNFVKISRITVDRGGGLFPAPFLLILLCGPLPPLQSPSPSPLGQFTVDAQSRLANASLLP